MRTFVVFTKYEKMCALKQDNKAPFLQEKKNKISKKNGFGIKQNSINFDIV